MTTKVINIKKPTDPTVKASAESLKDSVAMRVRIASGHKKKS